MNILMLIVLFAVILAVSFAALNFYLVKKKEEGSERMKEIAAAIREGANAFIFYEYIYRDAQSRDHQEGGRL